VPTIQILSDLHFEFHADGGREFVASLDPSGVDVLVVAGDLASYPVLGASIDLLCERYSAVVYVTGNHEYYHSSPAEVHALLDAAGRRHAHFHWLHESLVEIDDVRFVGTTLWFRDVPSAVPYRTWMSDFQMIDGFVPWVYEVNTRAREFLAQDVRSGDVVVTHHLPSPRSVHAKYVGNPLDPFFVCDVGSVIEDNEPELWIHGHTHERVDYTLCATRVIANPLGYVGFESQAHFDRNLRVTV